MGDNEDGEISDGEISSDGETETQVATQKRLVTQQSEPYTLFVSNRVNKGTGANHFAKKVQNSFMSLYELKLLCD